jgi:predicted DCC family thiol-disulfide oxidoreductase YuxK
MSPTTQGAHPRPTLIYDGDCGICKKWVTYWEGLTGARVVYRAYQDAAQDYPDIPLDAFRHAIQFVETDAHVYSGAAATYRVLRYAPGRRVWWWIYAYVPGFAPASEWAYAFFARRRGLLSRVTQLLWGTALEGDRYDAVIWLFLRGLGLIYFAAFASLAAQVLGLVGSAGVLPVQSFLHAAREYYGIAAYGIAPTLFWLNSSDTALVAGTWAGMALALLVVSGIAVRVALVGLFALYLSYVYAGQAFMAYQWDELLLEVGFLAIFLTGGSRIVIWLYRWLLFRYLFMAGAAKLVSGDATWRNLTALEYHFGTQPLPTPLAWYAAQLPQWMLVGGTAATLATEVGLAFLVFAPRRLRAAAAWCVLGFQSLIALTGNYNFFNLLTMLLCVFLFDDAALRSVLPTRLTAYVAERAPRVGRVATTIAVLVALMVVPDGINRIWQLLAGKGLPAADAVTDAIAPLLIVNSYGLFAQMTTDRPEIVVEGSDDGRQWRAYEFRYKAGSVSRPPPWCVPHQPRLDWQMWFASQGNASDSPWFGRFLRRLLENSPSVLGLLAANPFPDHPPKYVRAMLYDYRFADAKTHAATGQWWARSLEGIFFPPTSLSGPGPPGVEE